MKTITGRTFTKTYMADGYKHRIVVTAELHSIGDQEPYFSITGDIHWQAANNRWVFVAGGCIHDEIIEHFPELEPLVAMHLATANGVPMHAYDNAAYWAGATKWQERDVWMLADHLRIAVPVAEAMCDWVDRYYPADEHKPKKAWRKACEKMGLIELWQDQADNALKMLNYQPEEVK